MVDRGVETNGKAGTAKNRKSSNGAEETRTKNGGSAEENDDKDTGPEDTQRKGTRKRRKVNHGKCQDSPCFHCFLAGSLVAQDRQTAASSALLYVLSTVPEAGHVTRGVIVSYGAFMSPAECSGHRADYGVLTACVYCRRSVSEPARMLFCDP
jgi:hypothetical protein